MNNTYVIMFRDIVKVCTNDVCDRETCGRAHKKGSEWWNAEVGVVVAEKR